MKLEEIFREELLKKEFDVDSILILLEKQIKILKQHSQNKNYQKYEKRAKKLKLIFTEYQQKVEEILSKDWHEKDFETFEFEIQEEIQDPLIKFELDQQKHLKILRESMIHYIPLICKYLRKTIFISVVKNLDQ
jgi:DNA-binding ferritin-like protein (Dps family)